MTPRVSVALASHNGASFLRDQIRSVLAQTRLPDELVVSDDASTDDSIAIVREEVQRFHGSRSFDLRVVANPKALGVTGNFECAIGATTGEIIFLCDQDDIWNVDRVAGVLGIFEKDPEALMVVCNARLVDANGDPSGDSLFDALGLSHGERRALAGVDSLQALMRRNIVTGATSALRRSLFHQASPFPGEWLHDEWLAVVAALHNGIRMNPLSLVDYRQHGSNQIGVGRLGLRGKLLRIAEERTGRNQRLMARAHALYDRVLDESALHSAEYVEAITNKLAHERARSALPTARWRRIRPIAVEAASGGYSRSGLGAADIVRDLLQPAVLSSSS